MQRNAGPALTSPTAYYQSLARAIAALDMEKIERIKNRILQAIDSQSTIIVLGNGGSASTASHFVCDLAKGLAIGDCRPRVVALTDNIASLTAWANDTSYQDVFVEQLKAWNDPSTLVIAFSGSGDSENVIRAVAYARSQRMSTIGLSGFQGGRLKDLCDICLVVPSNNMQLIEDLHLSVCHCLYSVMNHTIQIKHKSTTVTSQAMAGD
jgi:D-sedoheptulose 7-phosphate isomerase